MLTKRKKNTTNYTTLQSKVKKIKTKKKRMAATNNSVGTETTKIMQSTEMIIISPGRTEIGRRERGEEIRISRATRIRTKIARAQMAATSSPGGRKTQRAARRI